MTSLLCEDFLEKNTLNYKVNNWDVESEQFQIKFKYIRGIKNTWADVRSRLVELDHDMCEYPEPEGQDMGIVCLSSWLMSLLYKRCNKKVTQISMK